MIQGMAASFYFSLLLKLSSTEVSTEEKDDSDDCLMRLDKREMRMETVGRKIYRLVLNAPPGGASTS